jgi:hypothetical protein
MKNIFVIAIAFFVLTSCNLCNKLSDSSDEKGVELIDNERKKTEESHDNVSSGIDSYEQESKMEIKGDDRIEMLVFDKRDLPRDISYNGYIVSGKRWLDKKGENILILTTTNIRTKPDRYNEEILSTAELYGYHYVSRSGNFTLLWKIYDFIKDCMFDVTLEHIRNSLTITDLDHDGIAESTFLYKMACRSDVSPAGLKLMMHEDDIKYALRGEMCINIEGYKEGGDYKIDKAFYNAPDEFLDYAKDQWREFSQEVF